MRYTYNDDNQVRYIYENVTGARDHNAEFTYDDDNRIASYRKGNGIRTYTYDLFDRVSSAVVTHKGAEILKTDYTFTAPSDTTASGQVATMRNKATDYDVTYSYTYDDNGNILSISDGTNTTSYVYDSANQLLRENNQAGNFTYTWTYDNAGNILNRKEYSYTTGELGEPTDTVTYTYDDSDWGDLLTIYDGNTITYDEIGNPLTDGTWTYTWEHGRQLDSMTDGETTWDYTYGADGLRTKRTDGTTTYDYIYYGGQLMYMYTDGHNFHFTYTPEGAPMGIVYQGYAYYYVTNLQGDVVAILNNKGEQVVTYTYDAWGNILSVSGSKADTLGTYNPLRYRGYVYDNETGLYYLQSRYYNPEVGRFINIDVAMGINGDMSTYDLFVYCGNNPIIRYDIGGASWKAAISGVLHIVNNFAISIGIDTAVIAGTILDMQKDDSGVYHANFDCWQQYFGYNDLYDVAFNIGTSMLSAKFKFSYNETNYIIWAWKGDYINLGAGAELGIYYGNDPHWLVDKSLAMPMAMCLEYKGETIISYTTGGEQWWCTGFNPAYQNVSAADLTASFRIRFYDPGMYSAFKSSMPKGWSFVDQWYTGIFTF